MLNFNKLGNIVSPNGASIIFGAESTEDNLNIQITNEDTYNPYSIVIVEEDTDETLPANQISYTTSPNSAITGETVQEAISELEQIIYTTTPRFQQEVKILTEGQSSCTLSQTFSSNSTMVFYNGLLINDSIHFSLSENIISFLGFVAEDGDILTLVSFASNGIPSLPPGFDESALIGGGY